MTMIYSDVSQKIRDLRMSKGITQVQLAEMLGVSKSVVSSYENSVHQPPYNILVRLANIFGVSCDYLLGVNQQDTVSVKGLTEAQIRAIEIMIDEARKLNEKNN